MRKLVYEHLEGIAAEKLIANQWVKNLNAVIDAFDNYQNWEQIKAPNNAVSLVSDPIGYFDKVLVRNAGITAPIGSSISADTVASLFNIDKAGFIEAVTLIAPGSAYGNDKGFKSIVKLPENKRSLFEWKDCTFKVNDTEMELLLDTYRVYATTAEQLELLAYWESFAATMNLHGKRQFINISLCNQIAQMVGLKHDRGVFDINRFALSDQFKQVKMPSAVKPSSVKPSSVKPIPTVSAPSKMIEED